MPWNTVSTHVVCFCAPWELTPLSKRRWKMCVFTVALSINQLRDRHSVHYILPNLMKLVIICAPHVAVVSSKNVQITCLVVAPLRNLRPQRNLIVQRPNMMSYWHEDNGTRYIASQELRSHTHNILLPISKLRNMDNNSHSHSHSQIYSHMSIGDDSIVFYAADHNLFTWTTELSRVNT